MPTPPTPENNPAAARIPAAHDPDGGLYSLVSGLVEAWEALPCDSDVSWWIDQQTRRLWAAGWRSRSA